MEVSGAFETATVETFWRTCSTFDGDIFTDLLDNGEQLSIENVWNRLFRLDDERHYSDLLLIGRLMTSCP